MPDLVIAQASDAETDPTTSANDARLVDIFGAAPPHVPDVPVRASQPLHTNPNLRKIIRRISAGDQNSENLMRWYVVPWINEQAERWRTDDVFAAVVASLVNRQQSRHVINASDSVHRNVPLDGILGYVGLRGQHITLEERLWLDTETKKNQRRTSTNGALPQRQPLPASQFDPITSAERTEAVAVLTALPRGFVQAVAQAYAADELSDRACPLYRVPDVASALLIARIISGSEPPMYDLPRDNERNRTLTPALQGQPRVLLFDCAGQRAPVGLARLATMTTFTGRPPYSKAPVTVPLQAVVILLVDAKSIAPGLAPHVVEIPAIAAADVDADKVRGAVQYFIRCGLGADPIQRVLSVLPAEPAVVAPEAENEARAVAIERFLELAHETFGGKPAPIGKITPPSKDEAFAELLADLNDDSGKIATFVELYFCSSRELAALGLGDDSSQWPKQLGTILKQTTLTEKSGHPHLTDGHPHLNGPQTTQNRASRYRVTATHPQRRAHYAVKLVAP